MRNHRLRERRLNLGATQELIGCLAGWPPPGAQSTVSAVERGLTKSPETIRRVRDAIVYLELGPRRDRQQARAEAKAADIVEAAVLLNRTRVIVDRLVDLLIDGRGDDFDTLALRCDPDVVELAGELYLDGIQPAAV